MIGSSGRGRGIDRASRLGTTLVRTTLVLSPFNMLRASLQATRLVLYQFFLEGRPMADTTSLHLRLPKRLYKRLQQQARRNNVSLNTEIVNQLAGYEAAMMQRTLEIVGPLLDKAVHTAVRAGTE